MKTYLMSSDANGWTDGCTRGQLYDHIPGQVKNLQDADVAIVSMICHPGYRFNHELNRLKGKKWILIDYCEFGWNWDPNRNNILGQGCVPCDFSNPGPIGECGTMDLFIRENPPVLTFKRELHTRDQGPTMQPIDFLAAGPIFPLETKDEFENRRLDLFFNWGYSHPDRPRVHGQIFEAMGNRNLNVISSFGHIGGKEGYYPPGTWATIFTPWWDRRPMYEVYSAQSKAKMSLCLPGAGKKCFREQEACNNSIIILQYDPLVRAYPWTSGVNCIKLAVGHEVEGIFDATHRQDLYEIYLLCQENMRRYRRENYIPNYLMPEIQARL